jgi:two-component system chemotaxis response regulator CheY
MQRCLVIETSPIIRKVTKAILTDFGFEVTETATGRDGLAAFNWQIPRLALVDAGIADMPALDVLRQMRDLAAGRVQILYCTTQFDVLELQRAHAAGATDLLIKPFDRHSLAAKLDGWQREGNSAPRENFFDRLSRSEIVRIA